MSISRAAESVDLLRCSFCGGSQRQVRKLITEPGIYICDECIELRNEIITEKLEGESFPLLELLPTPHEISGFLQVYIIGQENAKRVLSVAVYNHYRRMRAMRRREDSGTEMTKSDILLLGPTGTGKTHLARSLARSFKVPFCVVDATTLTEVGYVGEDVENILLRLIQTVDGNVKEAERGVIYIDKIDKISRKGENAPITRDVSGEDAQQALLKIIEGMVASVSPQGGCKHPHQDLIEINISSALFIAAGALAGIDGTVKARLGQRPTGFGSDLKLMKERGDLYAKITPDNLHKFGLTPRFIGRLPMITNVSALNVDDLSRVLIEPRNAILKQYQHLFELDEVKLTFTNEVIREVVRVAEKRGTGARSLSVLMEQTLAAIMFDLPSCDDVTKVIIEPECASAGAEPTLVLHEAGTSQAKGA